MTDTSILVVEDSPTQAEALRIDLEAAGYTVTVVPRGELALEALEEGGFDLVLSDIVMPGSVDGYELCRRIKGGPRHGLPVVLLTSLSDPMDIIRGLECGADNFLTKPYQPEVLLERLELLLRNRRLRSRNRLQTGVKVLFMGREYLITSEREQILDLLITTFEEAVQQNRALRQREEELTEARNALARYARSLEARLEQVLQSVPDALFSVDPSWETIHYVSPGAQHVFGCDPDRFSMRYWREHLFEDDRALVETARKGAVVDGEPRTLEYRFRANGNAPRWVLETVVPVHGEDAVERVDGIARDVTQLRESETRYLRSEEQVRLLLESTAEGIYGLDLDGNCTFCNPAAARLLGYDDPDRLLGQNMHALVHHRRGPDRPFPETECPICRRSRAGTGVHVVDEVFRRSDGTAFPVECWSYPVRRDGDIVGSVVTFLDITERKTLEEQARRSQKLEAVGRLAGGVAHDFNNLLTVILGEAELSLTGGTLSPDDTRSFEEIHRAGERARILTRQLLTFSRREVVEPIVFDLNDVVQELETMLHRLIGEDIELIIRLAPDLGAVHADRGQTEQVLMNLVVNARDAMPDGGALTIETGDVRLTGHEAQFRSDVVPGDYVVLSVSDTGTGISADVREHLFEPFFTTKEAGKGTGLGLATSYGIVRQAGGHIAAYSEEGLGSTFRVYLPHSSEPRARATHLGKTEVRGGSETVLVVEDEEALRRLAVRILEPLGYQVLAAASAEEALALARRMEEPPDVLVTDVILPGLGGRELADRLGSLWPGLKVLFASGYTEDVIRRHRLLDQEVRLIRKPFSVDELAHAVRLALDE